MYLFMIISFILLFSGYNKEFAFHPMYITNNYEIYWFVSYIIYIIPSAVGIIMSVLICIFYSLEKEKKIGSVNFIFSTLLKGILISVTTYALSFLKLDFLNFYIVSIWPIFFLDISIGCFIN